MLLMNNNKIFNKNKQKNKLLAKSDLASGLKIRTRIAPSPTGLFHIGTARTALFNYLFTKKYGGKFIFRIEDTDLERSDKKYEEDIINGLKWLGIKWDNKTYRQSERLDIYEKYLKKLFYEGKAFWCYHTKEELKKEKEEQISKKNTPRHICEHKFETRNLKQGIIRLKTPSKIVKFNDLIRGEISFDTSLLGDISLAKDFRIPLYNFAVVIDDYEMKISHVIRGEDHISNTPKQILIQEALEFSMLKYAHLPLILGTDKSKLSKRHGATSVSEYQEQGYLPEALINFIALLGWAPSDNREFFSLKELIKEFSLEKVQKGGAVFNIEKLNWINGIYFKKMSIKKLTELCLPYIEEKNLNFKSEILKKSQINSRPQITNLKYLKKIIKLEQPRLVKLSEIAEKTNYFFSEPKYDKELLKWKNMNDAEIKEFLEKSSEIASKIPTEKFKLKNIEKIFLKEAEKIGDRGRLLWPLRVAMSGKKFSPGPFEIADILGKKEILKRISFALKLVEIKTY